MGSSPVSNAEVADAAWSSPRSSREARPRPSGFKPGDELVRVGDLAVANTLDIERGLLDVRPGRPAKVTIRRGNIETAMTLDVKPFCGMPSATPDDQVWRAPGTENAAGVDRVRRRGLAQAPRRALHPGRLARKPRRTGLHPERRHPGRHECRLTALGNDSSRQHPLRAPAARDRPDTKCRCSTSSGATASNRAASRSPTR